MLSQGYGFYSMSGIVVSELKNPALGSIALINDLFREIFAIILMYCIGWRYPRSAIASAAATAVRMFLFQWLNKLAVMTLSPMQWSAVLFSLFLPHCC